MPAYLSQQSSKGFRAQGFEIRLLPAPHFLSLIDRGVLRRYDGNRDPSCLFPIEYDLSGISGAETTIAWEWQVCEAFQYRALATSFAIRSHGNERIFKTNLDWSPTTSS